MIRLVENAGIVTAGLFHHECKPGRTGLRALGADMPDFLHILPEQLTLNQFLHWKNTSARQIIFLALLHYCYPKRTSLLWSACGEPLLVDGIYNMIFHAHIHIDTQVRGCD